MNDSPTFFALSPLRRLKWCAEAAWLGSRCDKDPAFDIIVTTYIARFSSYFKGMLFQLSRLFRGFRIVVVVNGHHNREQQEVYLERLRRYVSRFADVHLVICEEPVGLSTMWNRAVAETRGERVLILNDDLYLMSRFRRKLQDSSLQSSSMALINGSWSHFLITRRVYEEVGPFDDNFREIGYEDRDYEARLALAGIEIDNVSVAGIVNCVEQPEEYSYGESMAISDGKYSSFNRDYFFRKWLVSEQDSPGAVYVPKLGKWLSIADSGTQSQSALRSAQ